MASPARVAAAVLAACALASTVMAPARAEPTPPGAQPPASSYLPTAPTPAPPRPVALPPQVEDAGGFTPEMAKAWDAAVKAAKAEGVTLTLTSGHRPRADQEELWADGLRKYGTAAEARKWVAVPWESAHVRGLAVDAGPNPATMAWLEAHQDQFGLCRRFSNEPWHFELKRPEWPTCPALLPSAATTMA